MRQMRLMKRQGDDALSIKILREGSCGILSVMGDEGYPYGVPLNYAYDNGCIYFHSAREGHKIDSVKADSKVSFCVIGCDKVLPEKFATAYASVIAFGRAEILREEKDIFYAMRLLTEKYSPNHKELGEKYMMEDISNYCAVCIHIENLTSKTGAQYDR